MDTYIKHIKPFLEKMEPMELMPTGAVPFTEKDTSIKAVVFDIYGTLIISASGDIMQDRYDASMFRDALKASGFRIINDKVDLLIIHSFFQDSISRAKQQAVKEGRPFPELNIVEIWGETLQKAANENIISFTQDSNIKLFTFIFELKSNRVWPMPGLKETIGHLKEKGIPLGIVSNAQFYTPVMMNYFLYGLVKDEEFLDGFEHDLSVFSYKIRRGKPDVAIYKELLPSIEKRGLKPEEVLFVGNDMLKDIYAASQVGLKTCFFAGDTRAYRLREDHPKASKVKPDFTITALEQLTDILLT